MPIKTKIAQKIQNEIDAYVEKKSVLDSKINLSKSDKTNEYFTVDNKHADTGYMTLLSEGSVLYGDDTIRLYIAKGTLSKWYDSLDDDYQGYVTVGHVSLDAFPVRQGYFEKSDLKIVTDSSGRSDLLVKPHINLELSAVQDLIIQDEPFAISSEFGWYDMIDPDIEEYTKLVVYNIEHGGDVYVPITDNVEIYGFSFVGNCGNAKSGGYEPSLLQRNEEERLNKKEILNKVLEHLNADTGAEEVVATEEVVEEVEAEKAETELGQSVAELAVARITELEKQVADLTAEKEALEKENAELKANESAVDEQFSKLEALLGKANVSVEKLEQKKEDEKPTNRFGRSRFGGLN